MAWSKHFLFTVCSPCRFALIGWPSCCRIKCIKCLLVTTERPLLAKTYNNHMPYTVYSRALRGTVFLIPLPPAPTGFLTITARTRNVCVTVPPAPAVFMSTPARTRKYSDSLCPHNNRDPLILCLLPSRREKHGVRKALLFRCFHLVLMK